MEEEKREKEFAGSKRRLFAEAASLREETEAEGQEPLSEITFANFIFSLSSTAMYHFGDIPDPLTNETRKNLAAAKQTIDILGLLRTKTLGNLDEREQELLDGILYELRLRFVKEVKKP